MIHLKINTKSQLQNWKDFLLQLLILLPISCYSYYKYRIDMVLYPYIIFIFIQFLFTLYLHVVYYLKNYNEEFFIFDNKIEKLKNGNKILFNSFDIKKIVICKSANMDKWGIPYTTFESFRIARVYLKNGNYFIMTNLLEYDLESSFITLKDVPIERRKGLSFFI
jgi:hypothetical protein